MKHKPRDKPEVKAREAPPKIREVTGTVEILCPFCEIPHPVSAGGEAACGTALRVTAIQTIYPARTVNRHKLVCVKCHKSGGEMARFNNGYVHTHDCAPNTKLMAQAPKFSEFAAFVFRLPKSIRSRIEARLGPVKRVDEVDAEGAETGKTLGYFFYKGGA